MIELLQTKIERCLTNTGYYPRMILGPNQHFASKVGYIDSYRGTERHPTAGSLTATTS